MITVKFPLFYEVGQHLVKFKQNYGKFKLHVIYIFLLSKLDLLLYRVMHGHIFQAFDIFHIFLANASKRFDMLYVLNIHFSVAPIDVFYTHGD